MYFQIDKKKLVNRFKDYVKKFDDKYDNYKPSNSKQLDSPTRYYVLDRIRSLYHWVVSEIILDLRHEFIHDDVAFAKLKGELDNYIRNKIRMNSNGELYLRIKDVEFDGSREQYKDYILQNRSKLISLFGKIIDELNSLFSGDLELDKNKPILNDTIDKREISESTVIEENKNIFINEQDFTLMNILGKINE